jgi:hypothetical protein
MNLMSAKCPGCGRPMRVVRARCDGCDAVLEGDFELPPLAMLSPEDQLFVTAFVRGHGSIRKMEALFDISYPTVKNRLNAIVAHLDRAFQGPTPNARVLELLARGEITVDEALRRIV